MDNQTEDLWLAHVTESDLGTGVFVLPATSEVNLGEYDWHMESRSKVLGPLYKCLLRDIPYLDCIGWASNKSVLSFKWIPGRLADFQTVLDSASRCSQTHVFCVKRCAGYGCQCIAGECV